MQFDEETTLAKTLYNRCWELLETTARTPDQDVELLTSAFASAGPVGRDIGKEVST